MCGIAGFLGHHGRLDDPRETLRRMTSSLRHRGPDGEGHYVDADIALGVRRLRVIDLQTGDQPLANESRAVWAALNGEIYNFRFLRAALEGLGHRFRTRSDTEVVVHAYEEYGEECVSHLDGMFALAVWDTPRRQLLLARDRMGEKPLYYYATADGVVFGSELRALLAHPAVPRQLSLPGLAAYLAFEFVPDPRSILVGIAKLPPGHTLTICADDGKLRLARYWDLAFEPETGVSADEWEARLLDQLRVSVARRLVSDVPVGFFLSGGIDSSAVVALAAQVSAGRPKTFAVGFEESTYDERPYARAVAEHCGAEHEEIVFTVTDAKRLLGNAGRENVGALLDEPIADASFLPTFMLSRAARESVTVALSGDGGDELFCGYPTFPAAALARGIDRWSPRWLVNEATRLVSALPASARYGSVDFLLKQFFRALPYPPAVRTQLLLGGSTPIELSTLLSPGVRAALSGDDPFDDLVSAMCSAPTTRALDQLIYQHCKFYLAGHNLVNVDRASMAVGLEVRAPFLDPALVRLSTRMPGELKLRGLRMKHVLKRALRAYLPAPILRRRKQGFGVPTAAWLRGPLRPVLEERLSADRVARVGLFDPHTVSRLIAEHTTGRWNHRKVLWALLMFDAWREYYLDRARWP